MKRVAGRILKKPGCGTRLSQGQEEMTEDNLRHTVTLFMSGARRWLTCVLLGTTAAMILQLH